MTLAGVNALIGGIGAGYARFTGAGVLDAASGVTLRNSANDYTGQTVFYSGGTYGFTSIGNLGEASSLGAPATSANGIVVVNAGGGLGGTLNYSGDGDTSNRGFRFANTSSGGTALVNNGTGVLGVNGDILLVRCIRF